MPQDQNEQKEAARPLPRLLTGLAVAAAVAAIWTVSVPRPLPADTLLVISTAATPGPLPSDHKPLLHIDFVDGRLHLRMLDDKGKTTIDLLEGQISAGNQSDLSLLKECIQLHLKGVDRSYEIIDRSVAMSRTADNIGASINNLWVLLCFVLIFMMQPGFAFLESGLIRFTNVINVLFKTTISTCISGVCFLLIGYSLMWNSGLRISDLRGTLDFAWLSPWSFSGGISPSAHFLFQLAFAMTAVTIVSGAVAGRINLYAYLISTFCMSTFVYSVSGYWAWNEHGWLFKMDFHDFAGSSVVHCVGGFAGLAGVLLLGPRIALVTGDDPASLNTLGKEEFQAADILNFNQSSNKPHNVGFATLGTFLLWMGWFGFNGGSELAMHGVDKDGVSHLYNVGRIVMNTFIAGCSGGVAAMIVAGVWTQMTEKGSRLQLDLEDVLNGVLGGCVAITACCDLVKHPLTAVLIGGLAGCLVFATVSYLFTNRSRLKIDDPVGAIAVHAMCGMLGTLACGFLGEKAGIRALGVQALGLLAISGWSFVVSFTVFWVLKKADFLRASKLDEIRGLDRTYHGKSAYKL